MNLNLSKFLRFCSIYGFSRTLYKALGRLRNIPSIFKFRNINGQDKTSVDFIGCGQFSFATMSYFLRFSNKFHFEFAFDVEQGVMNYFFEFNNNAKKLETAESTNSHFVDIVYIASNHYSHSDYAISALKRGVSVYIEKPIAVNWEQFYLLGKVISEEQADVYVGYNRPFSSAITELKSHINENSGTFSLSCFLVGHFLVHLIFNNLGMNFEAGKKLAIHKFSPYERANKYLNIVNGFKG